MMMMMMLLIVKIVQLESITALIRTSCFDCSVAASKKVWIRLLRGLVESAEEMWSSLTDASLAAVDLVGVVWICCDF